MELEHVATEDELMEETEILYKGMRELVVRTKVNEVFEDYQAIYDETVEMQGDKEVGRKDGGRDRVR